MAGDFKIKRYLAYVLKAAGEMRDVAPGERLQSDLLAGVMTNADDREENDANQLSRSLLGRWIGSRQKLWSGGHGGV